MLPVVREAGRVALNFFTEKNYSVKNKGLGINNPVTEADLEVNRILSEAISDYFADDVIVSEETYEQDQRAIDKARAQAERVWILDPIDGTREFVEGVPHFALSVALVENGRPTLGIVYNPAREFLIHGGPTLRIMLNGKEVGPAREPQNLGEVRVCLSRSEHKKGLFKFLEPHISFTEEQIIGSIAYKLGLVAAGEYDLIVSKKPKNDWDIAAGLCLLQGLGYNLYDGSWQPILLNQKSLKTKGLIGGSDATLALYKSINK